MISMAESFIFNTDGGAIAFLGSSAQTTPSAQMGIARNFYQKLAVKTNSWNRGDRLGDLFLQSKIESGSGAYERDIINSFSLIGDPALKLPGQVFAKKPVIAKSSNQNSNSGGGGCSANASDGELVPWYERYFEFFTYLFLVIGYFRMRRRLEKMFG